MASKASFDPLSQTSYFLSAIHNDQVLASGTCFFVERSGDTFLITTWHNITGRNPLTKDFLSYAAVAPDTLRVTIYNDQDVLELVDFDVRLFDADDNKVWLEHPVHFEHVDVVAIKVSIPEDKQVISPETFIEPFNEETTVSVKDDVFILGYPFGLSIVNIFPIWKRASIASEPVVDIDDLPKLYVDTATRPGMSGSPVIYKERRQVGIGKGKPGTPSFELSNNLMQIVGIYSGRIGADDEMKAQLGIVWKSRVIDEIISQEVCF